MATHRYRPDIDGLRALAILPVVWFHSGLPGLSGGFTGVDTFFVISGFLITGIVHREIAEGSFSLRNFYERRVRRIAPALLTVLVSTLIVGSYLLLPHELVKLSESAIASLLMLPNLYFWNEAGYFRLGEGVTPLLHTWSLGVEEQFYLFFPAALLALERFRMVKFGVISIAACSLALCVIATPLMPSASFYLLPTRAWELMLGGILALGTMSVPAAYRTFASIAGLTLLLLAAIFIGKSVQFPGWHAAIPAMGAALLIASGENGPVNRLISGSSFVWIGRISYSLYLWHWPVFAFLRHYRADTDLPLLWAVGGIALSFALAWATFHLVEQPARQRSLSYRKVAVGTSIVAIATICISAAIVTLSGLPQRFDRRVLLAADQRHDLAPLAHKCVNTPLQRVNAECLIGSGPPKAILWGDSHAAAVSWGVAEGLGVTTVVASMNSCAPTLGWTSPSLSSSDARQCVERNRTLLKLVSRDPSIQTVVLMAYWPSHSRAGGDKFWQSTQELITRLEGKTILVLAGTPEPGFDVPWVTAIQQRFGRGQLEWPCTPASVPIHGAIVADLSKTFCAYPEASKLFTDGNHPSLTANKKVIFPALRSMIKMTPEAPPEQTPMAGVQS